MASGNLMKGLGRAFKRGVAEEWTAERIAQLSVEEIKALRENADRLNEPEVAARCSEALSAARSRARKG
ncbi:MAG TPA: hypothetical protein VFC18_15425 [Burkholderiales bacterium]|nr:hypothetical protein [Burkholderiales bacterium]